MIDPADIEYISKFDLSMGFQHFKIQWPLKDLIKPKSSSQFETKVVCGNQTVALSWSLCIEKRLVDSTKTCFMTSLRTSDRITPITYRMFLSSSGNVLFDQSQSAIVDGITECVYVTSTSEVDKFVNDGGLVLNIWIDIPKAVALGDNFKKRKLCASEKVAEFISDHFKMFTRVVGTESDSSSDVALIIIDKEGKEVRRFQCHAIILVTRSPVFCKMLNSAKWKENCINNDRSVKIGDISDRVMETVLRFIYTSDLPDCLTENLCDIIYAADKYDLVLLKNWCVSCLFFDRYDGPRRYEQLVLADHHNLVQLKSVCLAHLSLWFPIGFFDHAFFVSIRRNLWSEIMNAYYKRQTHTTCIVLPTGDPMGEK